MTNESFKRHDNDMDIVLIFVSTSYVALQTDNLSQSGRFSALNTALITTMGPNDSSVDTNHDVQSNGTSIRNIFPLLVPPAYLGGQVCGLMPVSRSASLLHLVRFGASSVCVPTA